MLFRLFIAVMGIAVACAEPYVVEGLPTPVEVSLPVNHDPAKKWPAVFFYHGTGGHPTTQMIRQHTGPRDWIVVGMAYSQPGAFSYTPENIAKEVAILHRTRDGLAAKYGLDPARLYVSGFSMGGWMSGFFLQADRSLAGGAILGAGHLQEIAPKPAPFPRTPVFIGAGRLDGNYPFALKARLYYNKLGAAVTMETWNGLKHDFPAGGSPGLKEWFALRDGGAADAAAIDEEYEKLGKLEPLKQWQALLEFRERPYVIALGKPRTENVAKRIAELEADPAVSREAGLFKRHRQLLADEINATTLPALQKVAADYAALAQQSVHTEEGELIGSDCERVGKLVASFEAQAAQREKENPQVKPQPLPSKRTIPKNPLVR